MSQYNEPWKAAQQETDDYEKVWVLLDCQGYEVLEYEQSGFSPDCGCHPCIDRERAERIVACVNACEGIPMEVVAEPAFREMILDLLRATKSVTAHDPSKQPLADLIQVYLNREDRGE